jgi:hypothetical protein
MKQEREKGGESVSQSRLVQSTMLDKVAEKEWYERNKKWAVPVGCLVAIVVIVGFFGGICLIAFSAFKHSGVYVESLKQVHASPAVVQALGEPIEERFFVFGSIHVNGPSGEADISIPISGPKGSGTIYAVATKSAGIWHFELLEVGIKGSEDRIDLLDDK